MFSDWSQFVPYLIQAEQQGQVTRTFRRLDRARQQAVLQAILDEAARVGPSALNIKQVAQHAGSPLARSTSIWATGTVFGLCRRSVSLPPSPPLIWFVPTWRLCRTPGAGSLCQRRRRWSRAEAGFLQLFARAAYQGDPELAERLVVPVSNKLREMVNEILVQADAHGEIRPGVDLEAATRLVYGLSGSAVADSQLLPYLNHYFQIIDPALPPERILEALLD